MKEHQNLEWKVSWRDEYLRWICGFANAEGGVLVIGRDDNGAAVGVTDAARLLEDIPNKVRDVLGIMVDVNLLREGGEGSKEMVEVRVAPYPSPISYKGEYHYRSGSTKQELKGAALAHFLLKKQGLHWDAMPVPSLKASDLDPTAMSLFRRQAQRSQRLPDAALIEPDALLLERLHLIADGVCKRATALLFHAQPSRWFTGSYVKIGFFENDAELRHQDEVDGPLLAQVNKTVEVLQAKYLKATISYDGLQRVETWPVPMQALREAVLNAVVHKDYTSGAPIQISVYPDQLLIWNAGSLPPEWTVARLLSKHPSAPFNPDVANAFFRSGQIESWGRGIERMMQVCLDAGLPAPVLEADAVGVCVTFHYALGGGGDNGALVKTPVETPVETPVKTPELILGALRAKPDWTLAELAQSLGKSQSAVERAAAKLVKAGKLRFVGPKKGGYWEVMK
jgi:ATP-dependent DNA helicase RecG